MHLVNVYMSNTLDLEMVNGKGTVVSKVLRLSGQLY